jgi:large subunit ribosomal protein L17
MRHGKKVNHLGRKKAHRTAMLANMACSLIEHKRINTTVAKAKALKVFVEPLITKAKAENNKTTEKGTHNRRVVFSKLRDKNAVAHLFDAVSEKVADRQGGYTRIIKLGNRLGDNADMAMIELVDFNEIYNADKPKAKKTRRRKKATPATEAPVVEAAVEETPAVEEVVEAEVAVEETVVEEAPAVEEQASEEATEVKNEEESDDKE